MSNTAMAQRPTTLQPELERLLSTRPPELSAAIRRVVSNVRPCVRLETTRISSVPLRGKLVDRLLRRPPPEPMLPITTSKFGGIAYAEHDAELAGARFLGQINFAEVARALARQNFPQPEGMPDSGLLAVDLRPSDISPLRASVRWYPDPSETKAVRLKSVDCVAKYEAGVRFVGSWSLRGLEWFDAVPKGDDELWTYMNELELAGVDEEGWHKLLGHPTRLSMNTMGSIQSRADPTTSATTRCYG